LYKWKEFFLDLWYPPPVLFWKEDISATVHGVKIMIFTVWDLLVLIYPFIVEKITPQIFFSVWLSSDESFIFFHGITHIY
jgi:hypothetical protein